MLTFHLRRIVVNLLLYTIWRYFKSECLPGLFGTQRKRKAKHGNLLGEGQSRQFSECVSIKAECSSYTQQLSLKGPHHLSVTQDSTCYLDTSWHPLRPRVMLWLRCLMCVRQSINLINCELNICATFNSPWELLCISLFNYIASPLPVMNNLPVEHKCFCREQESKTGSNESSVYQPGIGVC